jgi:hypothetical protein
MPEGIEIIDHKIILRSRLVRWQLFTFFSTVGCRQKDCLIKKQGLFECLLTLHSCKRNNSSGANVQELQEHNTRAFNLFDKIYDFWELYKMFILYSVILVWILFTYLFTSFFFVTYCIWSLKYKWILVWQISRAVSISFGVWSWPLTSA